MSVFGGPSAKAALSVAEALHGNVKKLILGDGYTVHHKATVQLSSSGAVLEGVIYSGKTSPTITRDIVGMSVMVTKAGGRWIILS